jgi:sulfane dehydrogenase subunit SoxC
MSSTPESTRRRFLKGGIAIGAAFVATAPSPARTQSAPDDPSKLLGGPARPYGERSRFEQAERVKQGVPKTDEVAVGNATPLHETVGIITPSALHYEVHRSGVPDIDPPSIAS